MTPHTIPRIPADAWRIVQFTYELKGLKLTGIQAATLVDEIHNCIVDGAYMDIGSVDLNSVAGTMLKECEDFGVTT